MPTTESRNPETCSYTLCAIGADLDASVFKKPPSPYLEVILPKTSYRTSNIKNTYKLVWDRTFRLAAYSPETNVIVRIKQSTSSRASSKVIGETTLPLETLHAICRHDGSACLEIRSPGEGGRRVGTVILQLQENVNQDTDVSVLRQDLSRLHMEMKNDIGILRDGRAASSPVTPTDRILARMQTLGTMVTHLSEVHPLLGLACNAVSVLRKTIQHQSDLNQNMLNLFTQMEQILAFVEDVNVTSDKIKRFEDTIIEVLTVIRESCRFLEEYIRCNSKRRFIWQTVTGVPDRFVHFRETLSRLQSHLDRNVLSQLLVTVENLQPKPNNLAPSLVDSRNASVPGPTVAFTGREDILDKLVKYFDVDTASVRCRNQRVFVLWGLGGSGKTQIALKFASMQFAKFSGVYMVDASSVESIRSSLSNIGRAAQLGDLTPEKTLEWFSQQETEWLLIFDNADNPQVDLREFFPQCSYGNILITSRNRECRIHAPEANVNVSTLNEDDALRLLVKIAGQSATEDVGLALNIVKELGFLALAIVQAGSYILSGRCSLSEYSELYKTRRCELLSHTSIQHTDSYQYTVYTTWEINFGKLTSFTQALFNVCAFLYRDGISKEVFRRAVMGLSRGTPIESHNPLDPAVLPVDHSVTLLAGFRQASGDWDDMRFGQVVSDLLSYSLIVERGDGLYSIHPLVQSWARDRLPSESQQGQDARLCTVCMLYYSLSFDDNVGPRWLRQIHENQLWEISRFSHTDMIKATFADALHALGLYNHAAKVRDEVVQFRQPLLGDDHPATLDAMSSMSVTLRELGRWKEAQRIGVTVLKFRRRVLGPMHLDTLETMSELGVLYSQSGEWIRAEKLAKKVLRYRIQLLGDDHPDTLMALSRFSDIMRFLGRFRMAESMDLQVYDIRYRLHKDDQSHILDAMASLANTHKELGRYRQAEYLELLVSDGCKQLFGEKHPKTLLSMCRIARIYCDLRMDRKAQTLIVRVVEAQKHILGDKHPDTLYSLVQLSNVHYYLGEYQEMKLLDEYVVDARKELLGNEHPDTLHAIASLSLTYRDLGRDQEAEQLQISVLSTRKQLFGNEHPDTLLVMADLACTRSKLGKYREAEHLQDMVLSSQKRLLGNEHPRTLWAMANLASTYYSCGRYQEAEHLQDSVLSAQKQLLGNQHPGTLLAMADLALTYHGLGRYQEAEWLQDSVLSARKQLLGNEHPDTLWAMADFASTYRSLGRYQEAEQLEDSVLSARKQLLGNEHPDTLSAIASLASTYCSLGRYQEAAQLEDSVLSARKQLLGDKHPDTLTAKINLACTHSHLGNYETAEEMQVYVLEESTYILGEKHPYILLLTRNLAWTWRALGKDQKAKELEDAAAQLQISYVG